LQNRRFLSQAISYHIRTDEGYEARSAEDGGDGYQAYLLFQPDLVITDIQMPVKSGIELIALIRRHDPNVRIVYMSGNLDRFQSVLEEEKKKYQVTFLEKPFSKAELNSGRNLAAIGPSNLSPGGSPPATTPTNPPRTSAPNTSATQSGPSSTTKQAPTTSATTQPAPGNLQKNAVAPNIPSNNAEANSTSENNRFLRNPTGKNGTDSSDVKRAASGTSKKEDGDSKHNRENRTSSSRDRE